jgi:hypothetical protein
VEPDIRRAIWTPYFETREVFTMGAAWPSYIVEKWERNEIGEVRFTGQSRTAQIESAARAAALREVAEKVAALPDFDSWTEERQPSDDAWCAKLGCEDSTHPVHHRFDGRAAVLAILTEATGASE